MLLQVVQEAQAVRGNKQDLQTLDRHADHTAELLSREMHKQDQAIAKKVTESVIALRTTFEVKRYGKQLQFVRQG